MRIGSSFIPDGIEAFEFLILTPAMCRSFLYFKRSISSTDVIFYHKELGSFHALLIKKSKKLLDTATVTHIIEL